jgi:hypothetical protein
MKSLKQLILVTTFAALACIGLRAQTVNLIAAIPFDFHAGDRLMPAGEYSIHEQGSLILLRGADNGSPAQALLTNRTDDRSPSRGGRLEFDRYGNEYFLTAVWNSSTQDGHQLLPTARQKELAKRGNVPAAATVALTGTK